MIPNSVSLRPDRIPDLVAGLRDGGFCVALYPLKNDFVRPCYREAQLAGWTQFLEIRTPRTIDAHGSKGGDSFFGTIYARPGQAAFQEYGGPRLLAPVRPDLAEKADAVKRTVEKFKA